MLEALQISFGFLIDPVPLSMILLGACLGILFGALPGFSPIIGMALLLPFTYGMDPMLAMVLYAGVIGSAHFGGSIPAILLNTPGTTPNACTCFDGFPMARQGKAARALAISATCAGLGTLIGLIALIIGIPIIRPFILSFMTPDFFWLIVFGLVTIAFASKGNLLKGLAGGGLGIILSFIGFSGMFAVERFTLNSYYLWDGFRLVPFVIGLFAISEIIIYASKGGTIARLEYSQEEKDTWWSQSVQGIKDVLSRPWHVVRSGLIGVVIGAIPGVGGSAANFISYTVSMQGSSHSQEYGKGSVEGLIASETANDAKDGPALLPTTAFGIPGSPDTAILLAALILHGLTPGPMLLRDNLPIVMMLIVGIFLSQIFTSGLGLAAASYLARVTKIQVHYLAPLILVLCVSGAYAFRGYIWDVLLAVVLGLVGYFLKKYDFRVITIVIGFMLGGMAERYFHTALQISRGSYLVFVRHPISVVLIILIFALLALPFFRRWMQKRREAAERKEIALIQGGAVVEEEKAAKEEVEPVTESEAREPWKTGEFAFLVVITLFVGAIVYSSLQFSPSVRLLPLLISSATMVFMIVLLIGQFYPQIMKQMEVGLEDLFGGSSPESEAEEAEEAIKGVRSVYRVMIWIVGFFACLFLFGFVVSVPLLLFSFVMLEGRVGVAKSLLFTAIFSAAVFIALNYLGITLWYGAIPEILPGILGGSNIPRL